MKLQIAENTNINIITVTAPSVSTLSQVILVTTYRYSDFRFETERQIHTGVFLIDTMQVVQFEMKRP